MNLRKYDPTMCLKQDAFQSQRHKDIERMEKGIS